MMVRRLSGVLYLHLLLLALPMGCAPTREKVIPPQSVIVQAQLDANGRVVELSVVDGDPRLHKAALTAASEAHYEKDCDDDGRPVPSSRRVVVWFGEDGKPFKTEFAVRVGKGIQASRLRRRVEPDYPPALKRAGIQGVVLLKVCVDKEGKPASIEPVRGHALLIPLAVAAVQEWRWAPTYLGCRPVPTIKTATVNFVIR